MFTVRLLSGRLLLKHLVADMAGGSRNRDRILETSCDPFNRCTLYDWLSGYCPVWLKTASSAIGFSKVTSFAVAGFGVLAVLCVARHNK